MTFWPLGMGKQLFWPAMRFELCTPEIERYVNITINFQKKDFFSSSNRRNSICTVELNHLNSENSLILKIPLIKLSTKTKPFYYILRYPQMKFEKLAATSCSFGRNYR